MYKEKCTFKSGLVIDFLRVAALLLFFRLVSWLKSMTLRTVNWCFMTNSHKEFISNINSRLLIFLMAVFPGDLWISYTLFMKMRFGEKHLMGITWYPNLSGIKTSY